MRVMDCAASGIMPAVCSAQCVHIMSASWRAGLVCWASVCARCLFVGQTSWMSRLGCAHWRADRPGAHVHHASKENNNDETRQGERRDKPGNIYRTHLAYPL